jgi:Protein of unknown function (DUF1566)
MRKSGLTLIAVCITLLWVEAGYTQSDEGGAGAESAQTVESGADGRFPQPAEGCPFEPQRFPATGQTTSYVAGDDGDIRAGAPLRYRDNGDGTITDENTNLIWEKKDQASGGLHNWSNAYPWEGTCSNSSTKLCGADADCSSGETCNVSGGEMTIFQWVAQLNIPPCFAHHCDWRIPNVKELQSIVDYETYLPPVDVAFNNNCTSGCTVDGANNTKKCSCTQSAGSSKGYYWSGSSYAPSPLVSPPGSMLAWGVIFGDGDVLSAGKTDHDYVRAVRCGLVRSDIQ